MFLRVDGLDVEFTKPDKCSICEKSIGEEESCNLYLMQNTETEEFVCIGVCTGCNERLGKPQAGQILTINEGE